MAEGARLESVYTATYQGFESPSLLQASLLRATPGTPGIIIVIQFAGIATSILEEIMIDFGFLKKLAWPFPRAFFKI